MTDVVVALAGPPASGKTSVAHAVAKRLDGTVLGFGDFVRAEARIRNVATDRASLQALGAKLHRSLGPTGFCDAVLARAGRTLEDRPVVWDGIRHVDVALRLRTLYPVPVRLVVLRPPEDERRERFRGEVGSDERLAAFERHPTEGELPQLERIADLVCPAPTIDGATRAVLQLLCAEG